MATNWFNSDGLYVKFGTNEATPGVAGEYGFLADGNDHVIEVRLDLATLTASNVIVDQNVWLPDNARITKLEVITTEAATGGTNVDVGLVRFDQTTEIDFDGLLVDFLTASMSTVGETIVLYQNTTVPAATAGTGALVGTVLTNPGYITAAASGTYTTGEVKLRIFFDHP